MKRKEVNRIQDGILVHPETTRMSGHNKFDEIIIKFRSEYGRSVIMLKKTVL